MNVTFRRGLLVLLLTFVTGRASAESAGIGTRLVMVGDIMLDEEPGKLVAAGGDPFAFCATFLQQSELCVGNLECVVATGGTKVDKSFNFRAHPRCLPLMQKYFGAVTVANNHSGDFGKDALAEQFDLFETAKFPYFGGGRNRKQAHRPFIFERDGAKIALLGFNEYRPREFEAGDSTAGVAWSTDEEVVADIQAAKRVADVVIPFMHWGQEGEDEPNGRQRSLARAMIDAGADVVVGAHPHRTQGVEYYKGRLIVYSLGNFVFNGFDEGPARRGWMLRLVLAGGKLVSWSTLPVHMDEQGRPHVEVGVASPAGELGSDKIEMRAAEKLDASS